MVLAREHNTSCPCPFKDLLVAVNDSTHPGERASMSDHYDTASMNRVRAPTSAKGCLLPCPLRAAGKTPVFFAIADPYESSPQNLRPESQCPRHFFTFVPTKVL
jgi:hypothetical protein